MTTTAPPPDVAEVPIGTPRPTGAVPLAPLGWLAAAIALGLVSLQQVDLGRLSDIGLITALPLTYFAAVGVLTVAYFRLLMRPAAERPGWLLWAHLITAVFLLHGVTAFVEAVPRFPTAWVHAGFVEHILRDHSTLPNLDARFSWPGFFSAAALVASAGGMSPLWFARWAPVAVELASLVALVPIARALGLGPRARWVALWLFCVANWVGQDYFSPQAFGFLLFLAFAAVLVRYFRPPSRDVPGVAWWARRTSGSTLLRRVASLRTLEGGTPESSNATRTALVGVLVTIAFATIVAHQLTPFALVVLAAALVAGRRTTLPALPVLVLVGAVAWISFAAKPYWQGHLSDVTGGIGRLGASVGSSLDARLRGSTGHLLVVRARVVAFVALWVLAAVGVVRLARRGRIPWTGTVAAAAPLSLAAVQSYGGEILLRVYLFSVPFLAVLAALAFVPGSARREGGGGGAEGAGGAAGPDSAAVAPSVRRGLVAAGVASAVLAMAFLLIRYGNERFESFTSSDVAAMDFVYAHAQPHDRVVAVNPSLPWENQGVGTYDYIGQIDRRWIGDGAAIANYLTPRKGTHATGGYLVLTGSEEAYGEIVEGRPAGWLAELESRALATGQVQVVFHNQDATVLWRPATGGDGA